MYIPGKDENTKLVKQVLMRRCLLMLVLLLRSVSIAVETRFKTIQDVVDLGTIFYLIQILILIVSMLIISGAIMI